MRAIVTAIVFFKQRTVCIINEWGCAEILPGKLPSHLREYRYETEGSGNIHLEEELCK